MVSSRPPTSLDLGSERSDTPRFELVALVAVAAFLLLAGKLAYVQLVSGSGYEEVATGNRIRVIQTAAPRGRIFDTEGRILAGTRSAFTITLDWEELVDLPETERNGILATLAGELSQAGHPGDRQWLEEQYQQARRRSLEPVVVAEDTSIELWISMNERHLPGVAAAPVPVRTYPYGDSAAHVLGYLGSVGDDDEADALNRVDPTSRYRAGSEVGRAGLEKLFERQLRGRPEIRRIEVDSKNRVVRTVEVVQAAMPGNDLHLTLNIDLQRAAEQALQQQLDTIDGPNGEAPTAGSFVALDPRDGGVVALASMPAFDPGAFVFGLEENNAEALFSDPDDPFLNRAVSGLYAAGSTFKPIPAYAALTSGARGEHEIWNDQGTYRLSGCRAAASTKGCVFRNARSVVMGPLAVREAISRSSDTYFYSLGEKFWIERDRYGEDVIQQTAERFGLGRPAGIELPGEAAGRIPSPQQRHDDNASFPEAFPDPKWYTGDNVNLSIGQGDLQLTPLQLANLYASIATGGTRYQPRIIARIADGVTGRTVLGFEPRIDADEALDGKALNAIRDGLFAVPVSGTAAGAFAGFPINQYPVAAKTGTAEVNGKADNALFAGYTLWPGSELAFAVVLEEAGFGGIAAAPVARQFFDWSLAAQGRADLASDRP